MSKLNRKYTALLLRAKLHPLALAKTKKLVNNASDLELVIIHSYVTAQLKARGLIDNE